METKTCFDKFNQSSYRQNWQQSKVHAFIKRHQIKGLINAGEGVSRVPFQQNDENSQLSQHLLHLKTSSSTVKSDIRCRQLEQTRFKDETNFMTTKARFIQDERHLIQAEIRKIKTLVDEVKDKKINAYMSTKSYEHILDRMKTDQIKNQIKRNQLEKQLTRLQKSYKDQTNKICQIKQLQFLSSKGVKEAQEQVKQLNGFRKQAAADLGSILQQKQAIEKKKQQRKEKSDQIKQMAAGDLQDADLIRMKNFIKVQLFLRGLLKNKMENLKKNYSPYELAFLKIKNNTTVKDASNLKADFYNFEASFNERANWAKYLQNQIVSLEQKKKQMKTQYKQLQIRQLEIMESLQQQKMKQSIQKNRRQLQTMADQSYIIVTSVKQWLKQQAKKMNIDVCNKADSEILKQICEELKLKKKQEF